MSGGQVLLRDMRFDEPKLTTAKEISDLQSYEDEIETSEQREAFERALEATKPVLQSDGYHISQLFDHLVRSNLIVDYNYESLIDVFDRSRDLSEYSWDEVKTLDDEFLPVFVNFVVSSKSRENLTRDIVLTDLEDYHIVTSIAERYEKKVSEFNVDLHGYFFTSLRNYLVHEGVPKSLIVLGGNDEENKTDRLTIKKDVLKESDNFTSEALGYMDAWEDTIDLEEAVRNYYNSTNQLYDWFFDYTETAYETEVREAKILDENARILQEIFFSHIDKSFTRIQWK